MELETDFKPKTFAVIGAGPVGCIVAAFLAKGGFEVILCDIDPELVKKAKTSGIIIEGSEHFQQTVSKTCTSIDELSTMNPEVIFITSKANALPLICSAIEPFYKKGMYVVSWQNGINTEYEIADILGANTAMRAVVNYGCSLIAPCHVTIPFHHYPHFIQELDPKSIQAARGIAKALTLSGLPTEHTDSIVSKVWSKGILNASMNPICAVTGLTMSQAMNDPIIFQIISSLLKECIMVARANEIALGWNYYPDAVAYLKKAGNHKPSMLMDLENKRKTEIDFLNGKFIEYGIQANIKTPFNLTMRALVKGLESKQQ